MSKNLQEDNIEAEVQRRLAQHQRLHEDKYRHVIDNVSEGIVVIQDGRFVFVNPSACKIVDYTTPELQGREFLLMVFPDDRDQVMDRYVRLLRGEDVEQRYAFRVLNRHAEPLWVELSAVVITWEGQPATLAFVSDIHERRCLEEKVRENLAERETILENSIVGIAFLDHQGRFRWFNSALAQIFGFTEKSLEHRIGKSLEPFYSSREAYLATGASASEAVRQGHAFETELQMHREDASVFWVHLSGKAVNNQDLSKGTVWVVMDITARIALEAELKRTSSEREAILQSTLVGITYSIDRHHVWVNRKFSEMIGYEPQELIGQWSLIHFPDEESWVKLGEEAYPVLTRGQPFSTEAQMKRKDGSLFWAQLFGRTVDVEDMGKGTIWTFLDITERKQAEEEISDALEKQKELNYLKSRFVSMTSHEFRTPLATILSSAELLKYYGEKLPVKERQDIIGSIEIAVKRMTKMLDDVLVIGKAESDMIEFHSAPLNLRQVCEQITNDVQRAARLGNADGPPHVISFDLSGDLSGELSGDLGDELADIELDEHLLQHILGNLLSNALKYSPPGSTVFFAVACGAQAIKFTISDQGIGLPAEDMPRLFESFFRASNVGNISGTGLGLSIVKRSVELHGGSIEVESTVNAGTCFVVSLPRVKHKNADASLGTTLPLL